ncbi:hypothetical protein GCM10012287_43500 [Streptomyces daqingensis]|uniref:SCO6045-like C-terminal domain-containing protein n=1 Tax=Streptomyces daqingensis TaxID=1472640 RepID=A0ABQ2MMG6_9ACTN|nr:hypothetical protein GCM10012287_43500 [Streptomyces daqingensis]
MAETHPGDGTSAARERLARAQTALLAALVADGPVPDGFDAERLAVQRRALIGKRADVVAKVAPELPEILGEKTFRTEFAAYARGRPMEGGYRRDALDFARRLTEEGRAVDRATRLKVRRWWLERSGATPPPEGRVRRALYRLRAARQAG